MDVTDLVFIDPVGTGYSRAVGGYEGKAFWGLKEDAQSMAEFIRSWMTENNRWGSPIFILGESYGTTRAAYVANILQKNMKISINGLVFVSQALDYQGSSPYIPDNIISYVTYVPTMAAAALYHGKVAPAPDNKEAFIEAARQFATNELLPGLFAGNRLKPEQKRQLVERLAYFTGLSPQYVERADLRISARRFAKELLRDESKTVGLLDARYLGDERDDLDDSMTPNDGDLDGYSTCDGDCDDSNDLMSPGQVEICDVFHFHDARSIEVYMRCKRYFDDCRNIGGLGVREALGYPDAHARFNRPHKGLPHLRRTVRGDGNAS